MLKEGMKVASGSYLNIFSENEYDNFGIPVTFDLFILLPEYQGDEKIKEVEQIAELTIKKFSTGCGSDFDLNGLKEKLNDALILFDVILIHIDSINRQ